MRRCNEQQSGKLADTYVYDENLSLSICFSALFPSLSLPLDFDLRIEEIIAGIEHHT